MNLDKLKTTDDINVAGKRVIVRADLNVPIKDGNVTDATRLERLVPGLKALASRGAKVVVISHFGRPKGIDPSLSLRPVAAALQGLMGSSVTFAEDCIGEKAAVAIQSLKDGDIAVLENLRFHKGEEKNDPEFAEELAKLGDLFIEDAFSSAHRAHASTEGLTHHLPSYAGPLLMEEIAALRTALEKPQRPTAAVVGGAKVSTKIPVLTNLVGKVDKLMIGKSLSEPEFDATARDILSEAKQKGCEIILPVDAVVAREFKEGAANEIVDVGNVPFDAMILDIGPQSIAHLSEVLASTKTLLWNGPMGAFEISPFGEGTFSLARTAAALTKAGKLVSVAGGGDTVAALNAAGATADFTYVSTAGGAFLEWLEGRELPGVAALTQ
jgi:phosphoglycerate kinase